MNHFMLVNRIHLRHNNAIFISICLVYYRGKAMHSTLFSLGPLTIHSYGLCMALAFVITFLLGTWIYKREGRNTDNLSVILCCIIIGGVFGARLLYVIQNWDVEFATTPLAVFEIWKGGLVFYGGFIGATLALIGGAIWVEKESPLVLGDFICTLLPLGHAIGRIGCFFHGCCFGALTQSSCGVSFPKGSPAFVQHVNQGLIDFTALQSLPVYATQLLEALGNLIIFSILMWCFNKNRPYKGVQTGCYLVLYACLRFIGELFRDDPRGEQILGLSISQFISCLLLVVGIGLCLRRPWLQRKQGK